MKRRMTNNEMTQRSASLVVWRRFGRGFWFVVQAAHPCERRLVGNGAGAGAAAHLLTG
jgi:hypothetical protein